MALRRSWKALVVASSVTLAGFDSEETPTLDQATCELGEVRSRVDEMWVTPPGLAPFRVRVNDAPIQAQLDPFTDGAAVRVAGVIQFEGRSAIDAFPIELAPHVSLAGGALRVARSSTFEVSDLASAEGAFHADLNASMIRFQDVAIDCAQLRLLDPRQTFVADPEAPPEGGEGRAAVLPAGAFTLRAAPSGETVLRGHAVVGLSILVVARERGWARIEHRLDGSLVTGWIRAEAIRPAAATYRGAPGDGATSRPRSACDRPRDPIPARIRAGSTVYGTPDGRAPWANASGEGSVVVDRPRGSGLVAIVEIPGLTFDARDRGADCEPLAYIDPEALDLDVVDEEGLALRRRGLSVRVERVDAGSDAEAMGLRAGDALIGFDDQNPFLGAFGSLDFPLHVVRRAMTDGGFRVLLRRGDSELELVAGQPTARRASQ